MPLWCDEKVLQLLKAIAHSKFPVMTANSGRQVSAIITIIIIIIIIIVSSIRSIRSIVIAQTTRRNNLALHGNCTQY